MDISDPDGTGEITFKVLVVGEPAVGKTSIINRYTKQKFDSSYKSTIGVDFCSKSIKWTDNITVTLHFWDMAGQERLNNQVRAYYKDTDGALCVCSIEREETKEQVLEWKNMVDEKSVRNNTLNFPPCVLLLNKIDLSGPDQSLDGFFTNYGITPSNNDMDTEKSNMYLVDVDENRDILNDIEKYANKISKGLKLFADDHNFKDAFPVCASMNVGVDDAITSLIHHMLIIREEELQNNQAGNEILHIIDDNSYNLEGRQTSCSKC